MADNQMRPPCLKLILIGFLFSCIINNILAQPSTGQSRLPSRWGQRFGLPQRSASQFRRRTVHVSRPFREEFSDSALRRLGAQRTFADQSRIPAQPISFQRPELSEIRVPAVQRSAISRREMSLEDMQRIRNPAQLQRFGDIRRQLPSNRLSQLSLRSPMVSARSRQPDYMQESMIPFSRQRQSMPPTGVADLSNFRSNNNNNNNGDLRTGMFPGLPPLSISRQPMQPSFRMQQTSSRRQSSQMLPSVRQVVLPRRRSGANAAASQARVQQQQQQPAAVSQRQQPGIITKQSERSLVRPQQSSEVLVPQQKQPIVVARKQIEPSLSRQQQVVVAQRQPVVIVAQKLPPQAPQAPVVQTQAVKIDIPPARASSAAAVLNQPVTPVVNQPAMPIVNQPAMPVVNQPAMPVVNQPAMPVVNQPAMPVVNQPAMPVGNVAIPVASVVTTGDLTALPGPIISQQVVTQQGASPPVATNVPIQPASTVPAGNSNLIFEELVNAFTDVLQNPAGQQQVPVPAVQQIHTQHPQSLLQNNLQPQSPMLIQQGAIMQPGGISQLGGVASPGVFGGHIHGNPYGFMNPWMMGGMSSSMMQEMMFGDTTDPPDPVVTTTTTVAPPAAAVPAAGPNKPSTLTAVADSAVAFATASSTAEVLPGTVSISDVNNAAVQPEVGPAVTKADKAPVSNVALTPAAVHVTSTDVQNAVIQPEVAPALKRQETVSNVELSPSVVDVASIGAPSPAVRQEVLPVAQKVDPVAISDAQNANVAPLMKKVDSVHVTAVGNVPVAPDITNLDVSNSANVISVVADSSAIVPENRNKPQRNSVEIGTKNQNTKQLNPTSITTQSKTPMSLEEKIMAEVAAMLPNSNIDMSMLSQVLGQVTNALKEPAVESVPSAGQLGLKTLEPDPNAKKLTRKEIVSQLKGSTRGVVVYPPTPPTVINHKNDVSSKTVLLDLTTDSKGLMYSVDSRSAQDVSSAVATANKKPEISKTKSTTGIPPNVEIPTLPPQTGNVATQPEVYRTLQTILDHNPAAVVQVLSDTATPTVPIPPEPKISVKSLVDIGTKNNLPMLQAILTEISTAPRNVTSAEAMNTSTSDNSPDKVVLNIEPVSNNLNDGQKINISALVYSEPPKVKEIKLQQLADEVTSTVTHTTIAPDFSHLSSQPTFPPENASLSDMTIPTEILPTEMYHDFTEQMITYGESYGKTNQTMTMKTFPPIVSPSTVTPTETTAPSFPPNYEGIPVNISKEINSGSLVMANMEGTPVNIEKVRNPFVRRIRSTDIPAVNKDATGALSILREIKAFGSSTTYKKQSDIEKKLSDPNFVKSLRGLLKTLIAQASSTTPSSTSSTLSTAATTTPPMSTTEEYEAEDFTTEAP